MGVDDKVAGCVEEWSPEGLAAEAVLQHYRNTCVMLFNHVEYTINVVSDVLCASAVQTRACTEIGKVVR